MNDIPKPNQPSGMGCGAPAGEGPFGPMFCGTFIGWSDVTTLCPACWLRNGLEPTERNAEAIRRLKN